MKSDAMFIRYALIFILMFQSFFIHAEIEFQEVANSPFTAENGPASAAFSPLVSGNLFAAVPNYFSNNVSVYQVDQVTGAFTQVPGSPFATGVIPTWQAFSPLVSGNLFSAVANTGSNNLTVHIVDQSTGVFTPVPASPVATLEGPYCVQFSQVVSGNLFLGVTYPAEQLISIYQVNQATGAMTEVPGSPFVTGNSPYTFAFSPLASGNLFAAVANYSANTVSVYVVNQSTGALTEVAGSPFPTGNGPYGVAYSPVIDGNLFAAVSNQFSNSISVYLVNQTTGAFTEVPGSPFPAGNQPDAIAFSPIINGILIATVGNYIDNTISVYTVNPQTGEFTQISTSPYASGSNPDGIAFSPVVSENLFIATANFSGNTTSVYKLIFPIPLPPPYFKGYIRKNKFLNKVEYILKANWGASPSPNVVFYRIYKGNKLVEQVSSNPPYIFVECLHSKHSAKDYSISAVNTDHQESERTKIRIVHED